MDFFVSNIVEIFFSNFVDISISNLDLDFQILDLLSDSQISFTFSDFEMFFRDIFWSSQYLFIVLEREDQQYFSTYLLKKIEFVHIFLLNSTFTADFMTDAHTHKHTPNKNKKLWTPINMKILGNWHLIYQALREYTHTYLLYFPDPFMLILEENSIYIYINILLFILLSFRCNVFYGVCNVGVLRCLLLRVDCICHCVCIAMISHIFSNFSMLAYV